MKNSTFSTIKLMINSDFLVYGVQFGLFLGTSAVFLAMATPSLNSLLFYGKTKTKISRFEQFYVPKRWFIHFYYLHSTLSTGSLIWYLTYYNRYDYYLSFVLVLLMNLIQAYRRLYECVFISKWDDVKSKIHITHYIAGIFFYTSANLMPILLRNSMWKPLSSKTGIYLILIMFILTSMDQYRNHSHLASLRKYSLPTHGLFQFVTCAHYFDEVVIYTLFALMYPSIGYFLLLLWVFVNLSISAIENRKWYVQKGLIRQDDEIRCIIPFIL